MCHESDLQESLRPSQPAEEKMEAKRRWSDEASSSTRLLLLLMLAIGFFPDIVDGLLREGLYVSNKTDILFIANPDSLNDGGVVSVYKPQLGRITGLTYDKCNDELFWSNVDVVNRGIYKGRLDADGRRVENVTKIISTDVLEVSGLSFDWVSRHLYWTDSRKKTIEVSDADGSNRRILVMSGRGIPRGIYADPINGYLFWTDQGLKHVARSNLDGSDRRSIVTQGVNLPNQITVSGDKLFWVDSFNKTFESSDLNGGQRLTVSVSALANDRHIFGLAVHDRRAYITNWINGRLVDIDTDGRNLARGAQNLGKEELFSAIYVKATHQPKRYDPCVTKSCAALCLPVRANETRCSCPSNGGQILNGTDRRTCISPTQSSSILLVAMADSGFVGFFDPSDTQKDFYVVGKSLRPVAVAYDPVTKNVFWSDVRERSIHLSNIDGTRHQILLRGQQGIGLVEGMLVDVKRRQLYYTNIGSVFIEDKPYSWHRIETFSLRSLNNVKVRTIVTTADKPRGLALDSPNGHLYYTDWGNRASIVRVNLDGSDPTLIRTGLDNPNGIAILSNRIFFVDSHFKTRHGGGQEADARRPKNGSLYSMDLNGNNLKDVLVEGSAAKLRTPFGLTVTPSAGLYVGDWETESLTLLNSDGTLSQTILQGTSGLMSLAYSSFTAADAGSSSSSCASRNCGDVCLSKTATEATCSCNSYGGKPINNTANSCSVPSQFLIVADMNSIKIVSQDKKDSNAYIAVQGNPFTSNFVGLAYDDVNRIVYYSDISGKRINALHLSNMTSTEFYRINEVIDGMVYHNASLYWTDYTNGRISRLNLNPTTTTAGSQGRGLRHDILIRNLKRPRGIRIHQNFMYWTEWGGTPRIARKDLREPRSSVEQMYRSLKLVWPNGISIYNEKLYLVDGSTKKIYRCALNNPSDSCQLVNGTESVLKHAYDLWATDDGSVFYYSDWETGSIRAFDANRPEKTWTVVGGLMRPTQFQFSSLSKRPECPARTCSSGSCVPLWINHGCDCQGKVPTYDLRNCTADSTTSCSYGGQSYGPDKSFSPSLCINCRCVGRRSWMNDPVYNDSVCEHISCPKLDCGGGQIYRPSNQCCPSCSSCRIKITNCPEKPMNFNLPSNQGYVVYDFLPTVKDCLGLAREVSTTRAPKGAIYKRGQEVVTVISTAVGGDAAECRITVVVNDVTAPTIRCPDGIQAFLTRDETSVEVKWKPPEVTENDELAGPAESSSPWGSPFHEGVHNVTYTVRDKAGLTGSCWFPVTVIKLNTPPQGNCKIPQIDNALLQCSVGISLSCMVEKCQETYEKVINWNSICSKGVWEHPVTNNLLRKTCIKKVKASIAGSLRVTVPSGEACIDEVDLKYTRDSLWNDIWKAHVRGADLELFLTVKGCGGSGSSTDGMVIDVSLFGQSSASDRANVTSKINELLSNIRTDLEREFIRVTINGRTEIRTAHDLSITTTAAVDRCLPGQIPNGDACEVCDVGTYAATTNNTCVRCPSDSYNDVRGGTDCKPCPKGTKSGAGSSIIDQCIKVGSEDFGLIVIVASACLGLLLLLLLVIAIVCLRRRRSSDKLSMTEHNPKVNMNKVFDPDQDDETYDKIGDPAAVEPTTKNNYESLEAAAAGGASANLYDKIVCSDEGDGGKAEACGGGNGDEDGKSTPPYLEPVNV